MGLAPQQAAGCQRPIEEAAHRRVGRAHANQMQKPRRSRTGVFRRQTRESIESVAGPGQRFTCAAAWSFRSPPPTKTTMSVQSSVLGFPRIGALLHFFSTAASNAIGGLWHLQNLTFCLSALFCGAAALQALCARSKRLLRPVSRFVHVILILIRTGMAYRCGTHRLGRQAQR